MKKIIHIIFLLIYVSGSQAIAQEVIQIEPLFEYPVAPDNLDSLEERCNYLVKNFWDGFNFKSKQTVDQNALNDAFMVYVSSMAYANDKYVEQSLDKLIEKISGNPALLLQFCKGAEVNLYGPKAQFWYDPYYLKFLDALIKNKKIPESRKTKYINQANSLRESAIDNIAPSFEFRNPLGEIKNYFPMTTPTILIFGNPEDTDWRLARLRMDSNFKLGEAIDKGKLNVLFILPSTQDNWKESFSLYNKKWTVGQSDDVSKHYDIRLIPSIYLIGADGKILMKNAPLNQVIESALGLLN